MKKIIIITSKGLRHRAFRVFLSSQKGINVLQTISEEGNKKVQDAINRYFPMLPSFFGRPNSKNNEIYRKWSIKQRKNEEMLEDYMKRTKDLVEELGLTLPTVTEPKL